MVSQRLPDTGPEDIAIIAVHHYPLAIEGIFENGAGDGDGSKWVDIGERWRGSSQIASGVIRGDISAACNVMLLSVIGDRAGTVWGWTLEGIVGGRGMIMLVDVDVLMSENQVGRVANATDLRWCGHGSSGEGRREEREGERSGLRAKIFVCFRLLCGRAGVKVKRDLNILLLIILIINIII